MALLHRMRSSASRRLTAVTIAVTAAVLAVAGTLTPALAANGPSLTVNAGMVNIAIQGPNNSLLFYWAANGVSPWNTVTVAGAGTTFSEPSMEVDGNSVAIAAQGPNNSLMFYWAVTGTPTWHAETVAGADTTFSPPSVGTDGRSVAIAAEGPGNSLDSYFQPNGGSSWALQVVQQPDSATTIPGTGAFSPPAVVVAGGLEYVAVEGFGKTLSVYDQQPGAFSWDWHLVGSANSQPSMTTTGNAINISTTSESGGVLFDWLFLGNVAWHEEIVGAGSFEATSIAKDNDSNAALIAATTFGGSMELFSAVYGTGSWSSAPVSGVDTVSPYEPAPSLVADDGDGYNDIYISVFGFKGTLQFDYSVYGSGTWFSVPVPGNGVGPHL